MEVLSVTPECAPLIKTGGLADVTGALPAALADAGCAVRTILPGYPRVMAAIGSTGRPVLGEEDLFGGRGELLSARAAGLDLLVLDAPHLYDREGNIYLGPGGTDWRDNPERFAALSWMAARVAREGADGWRPDIVQCHDWQAALTPVYLATGDGPRVPSVVTIHNIAFHGLAPADRRAALRLPEDGLSPSGFEFYGQISALKAGLIWADRLTTVSPTYAQELMTPDFGMGLDGVLRARRADLVGILNGIDTAAWDPATDAEIAAQYKSPRGKARNRAALHEEFGLPEGDGPLCVVISRMTEQKGLDLLLSALPALTDAGGRLALLGSGDAALEAAWRDIAEVSPAVSVRIGYDEGLSHRMIAGGDAIIVPSRFEPCGLTQMYGLRYGTIPVVALTGGLADTVIPANDAALKAGVATGLQFHPVTAGALTNALAMLCDLHSDTAEWSRLQRNAMRHPVGWPASAERYAALFRDIVSDP